MADFGIQFRCGACGHTADLWEFCRTPVFGELQHGTFQCPACKRAIRRSVNHRMRVEIVDVESVL